MVMVGRGPCCFLLMLVQVLRILGRNMAYLARSKACLQNVPVYGNALPAAQSTPRWESPKSADLYLKEQSYSPGNCSSSNRVLVQIHTPHFPSTLRGCWTWRGWKGQCSAAPSLLFFNLVWSLPWLDMRYIFLTCLSNLNTFEKFPQGLHIQK